MPHVVISGGAGFLGSHLCDAYHDAGWHVTALDNFITGSPRNVAHLDGSPRFTLIDADVSAALPPITGPVQLVLHFASIASPVRYTAHRLETLQSGSAGTLHMLELAWLHGAVFVVASSSEVYGDAAITPQPETYWGNVNPVGERSMYDESKRFAEALTVAYRHERSLDARIVRLFNTYGPRMALDDGRLVPAALNALNGRGPVTIFGDGHQTRSFCYVADTIRAIRRAAAVPSLAVPVNIGNPDEISVLSFLDVLAAAGGVARIDRVHAAAWPDDPKRRQPVIDRARELLGWEPSTPLSAGLAATVAALLVQPLDHVLGDRDDAPRDRDGRRVATQSARH